VVSRQRPKWAELWWCDFGEAGRRPVLVLTRPEAADRLPRLLVAPATTHVRDLPSEVHLDRDDGLPKPCVLNLDTPELVDRRALTDFISALSAQRWHEVCNALAGAINC
jgi:mRNA interferase MazF